MPELPYQSHRQVSLDVMIQQRDRTLHSKVQKEINSNFKLERVFKLKKRPIVISKSSRIFYSFISRKGYGKPTASFANLSVIYSLLVQINYLSPCGIEKFFFHSMAFSPVKNQASGQVNLANSQRDRLHLKHILYFGF